PDRTRRDAHHDGRQPVPAAGHSRRCVMKLPALALFERSLRLESRSALMIMTRAGLLVLILCLLYPIQMTARSGFGGAPGLEFLQFLCWANLVCITLAGASYFASAITEEKEESMLGLLRMTDLNP